MKFTTQIVITSNVNEFVSPDKVGFEGERSGAARNSDTSANQVARGVGSQNGVGGGFA